MTPSPLDERVRRALADCVAPGAARNIVQAGLVAGITINEDHDAPGAHVPGVPPRFAVRIALHAPTLDNEARAMLTAQIQNRLAGEAWISHTAILHTPPLFTILG